MRFINELEIDQASERLAAQGGDFEPLLRQLADEQPVLMAYILSESFEAFTHEEKDYFLYLTLVIYESVRNCGEPTAKIEEEQLAATEERNWALLQKVTTQRYPDRMDVFFQDYPQEDLLAFVEDALADDEDTFVSKESREPLFVSLKTVIDALTYQPAPKTT